MRKEVEKGYGNHSCNDCATKDCPISNFSSRPNTCSYYWPPMATGPKDKFGYYRELYKMARLGVVCKTIDEQ